MNHFDDSVYLEDQRIKEIFDYCHQSALHKISFFVPNGAALREIIIGNFLLAYREEEESAKRFIDYFQLTECEVESLWNDFDHFVSFYYKNSFYEVEA